MFLCVAMHCDCWSSSMRTRADFPTPDDSNDSSRCVTPNWNCRMRQRYYNRAMHDDDSVGWCDFCWCLYTEFDFRFFFGDKKKKKRKKEIGNCQFSMWFWANTKVEMEKCCAVRLYKSREMCNLFCGMWTWDICSWQFQQFLQIKSVQWQSNEGLCVCVCVCLSATNKQFTLNRNKRIYNR